MVQEKKQKIDFPDCHHGSHLEFPIRTILVSFDLKVTPMLPTNFQVNWHFGSGREAKNRFSRWPPWWPSWISDWNGFGVQDLSVQKKKRKIDFENGHNDSHLGFPTRTILASLDLQVTLMIPTNLKSIGLSVQEEKRKIDFQNGHHGGHLRFPIGKTLAIFDLQVTPMLPTKF